MFVLLRGLSKLINTRNSFISSSNIEYNSKISDGEYRLYRTNIKIGGINFLPTTRETLIIIHYIKELILISEVMTKEIDFPKDIINDINSYTDTELLYLTRELSDARLLQELNINQSKQEDIKIFFKEYDGKN